MTSAGKDFMIKTRLHQLGPSAQEQGLPQPPLELDYPPTAPLIPLPKPADIMNPQVDLRTVIERRISVRRYSDEPLSMEELSYLLWCTQGVKAVTKRPITLRTVPSAGARHAFETFVLANRVTGLNAGLYRFAAMEHALLETNVTSQIGEQIRNACLSQDQITGSAATFIWVAVLDRMYWRYGERGYRYLHLDAGHICQNLYLAAESIHCGVCAIAAFDDDELNQVLDLDGENLFAVYLASLGKRTNS
jgi:SagB-type dehydrogenase family enzyme